MLSSAINGLAMSNQLVACSALLLAAVILRLSPSWVRRAFFIVVFGCGLLAVAGGFATSMADAAVSALFG